MFTVWISKSSVTKRRKKYTNHHRDEKMTKNRHRTTTNSWKTSKNDQETKITNKKRLKVTTNDLTARFYDHSSFWSKSSAQKETQNNHKLCSHVVLSVLYSHSVFLTFHSSLEIWSFEFLVDVFFTSLYSFCASSWLFCNGLYSVCVCCRFASFWVSFAVYYISLGILYISLQMFCVSLGSFCISV